MNEAILNRLNSAVYNIKFSGCSISLLDISKLKIRSRASLSAPPLPCDCGKMTNELYDD